MPSTLWSAVAQMAVAKAGANANPSWRAVLLEAPTLPRFAAGAALIDIVWIAPVKIPALAPIRARRQVMSSDVQDPDSGAVSVRATASAIAEPPTTGLGPMASTTSPPNGLAIIDPTGIAR